MTTTSSTPDAGYADAARADGADPDKKRPARPRGGRGWWRRFWSEPLFALAALALIAGVLLFIAAPVVAVLARSFGLGATGFTLEHYTAFFGAYYLESYWNSFKAAALVTVAVSVLSVSMALYVTRNGGAIARTYSGLSLLPLVAPPFVFSLALIVLFGRSGLITSLLSDWFGLEFSIYGFWGVVLAQVLGYFPVAYMIVETTLRGVDSTLEHASRDLGAGQWRTLFRVCLPLAKQGIARGGLLVFVMALADFGNPLIIGGDAKFLASEAYLLVVGQHNLELAAVLGVFLILPSLVAFVLQGYVLRGDVTSIGGNSGAPPVPLTRSVKTSVLSVNTIVGGFILLMFAIVTMGAFVKIIGINNTPTLEYFGDSGGLEALRTSLFVSLVAALVAAALGVVQGYLFTRKPVPMRGAQEFFTLFGLAVPGTVMGIGYLLVFNGPPFWLVGTVLILVINMAARKIGVGMQASVSRMRQLDKSLEESSRDLGSGPYRTFGRVVVPLMLPSFVAGFVYAFMTSMVSVSSVIFLLTPGTKLAAPYILNLAASAQVGQAAALSVWIIAIVVCALALLKMIERRFGVRI